MKKFKNRLKVIGPLSLLEAFAKELDRIGYIRSITASKDDAIITEWNRVSGTYGFATKSHDVRFHETTTLTLPQDWDRALELAKEEEIELKPGKWYVDKYDTIFRYNHDGGGDNVGAINNDSLLAESLLRYRCCNNGNFRPATPEEIKEHLTKLAKHKGYENKCLKLIKSAVGDISKFPITFSKIEYNCETDELIVKPIDCRGNIIYCRGYIIYRQGKWAEIVEEQPEYVECVWGNSEAYREGRVYRVNRNGYVESESGLYITLWDNTSCSRSKFKPSTKEAYEKQNKVFFAGMEVYFEDGHVKIGCQRIDNEFVLSLNKLLGDEFKIVQRTPAGR